MARIGLCRLYNLFRRSLRDDSPAAHAALGSEVDHIVRSLNHVEIVLDNDNRIAAVHEALQNDEQLVDIRRMQSRRRLVENVKCLTRAALGQLRRELDALCLAAAKRRGGLSERNVAEPDVRERL